MSLSSFLKENAVEKEPIKFVASNRFLKEDGKPEEWTIKSVSSDEDEALRKACTKRVKALGKGNQYTNEVDFDKYLGKLAAECTVYPDLHNKELQESYGVVGEDRVLKRMLLAGEYAAYLEKVQEVCEFDVPLDDMVDEVKN